jgi:hypothetical protein
MQQVEPPASGPEAVSEPAQGSGVYERGRPLSSQAPASVLTLPAGTLISVRTTQTISSDRNRQGDAFTTILEQPLVAQGWVVSRRGQIVEGRVAVAQNAGRVRGVSQLALELTELVLVDGQQLPLRTQLVQTSEVTSRGRDVQGVGATTGIGALIGAAAGGGRGAAIGAATGAAVGVAGVLSTRGQPTEIYQETVLTFRLEEPVRIQTDQSQHAFRAVTADDYSDRGGLRNPPRRYPPAEIYHPRDYYSPYYYRGYYPYSGYFGYYGYGFGPRIYVGPRIHSRGGYHRFH